VSRSDHPVTLLEAINHLNPIIDLPPYGYSNRFKLLSIELKHHTMLLARWDDS
jgi:hypothetical protein